MATDYQDGNEQQLIPLYGYTSDKYFQMEIDSLFHRCWNFVGMSDDIPVTGDYQCVQVGKFPILVVRNEQGGIHAFHNLCSHRGMRLMERSGSAVRGFTCPYHRWFYKLDGRLTSIPRQKALFPDIDKSSLGLTPAAAGHFRGMIFVHPEESPEEKFSEFIANLESNIGPHNPGEMVEVNRQQFEFRANWKIVVENYMETYHLFHLHQKSVGMIDHNQFNWFPCGRHYMSYEPVSEQLKDWVMNTYDLSRHECVPGADPETYGAHIHMFFPGIGWTGMAHNWSSFHVKPVAVNKTIVETRTRVMPTAVGKGKSVTLQSDLIANTSAQVVTTGDSKTHPAESGNSMLEDMWVCEQVQLGFQSPRAKVAPLAKKYESMINHFQKNVLDFVNYD